MINYSLNKISLVRGGTYIDTSKCIKNKKVTINSKTNDDKCLQYAVAAALNFEQIRSHSEIISNIKPFINQYYWEEIDFPSHRKDWKKFESNNKSVALNMLIRHADI